MSDATKLGHLEELLDQFQQNESLRASIVDKLIDNLTKICSERNTYQEELRQAEELRDKYFEEQKKDRAQLHDLRLKMVQNPFVLVLIDADNTLFRDQYVQNGGVGGHEAARSLKAKIYTFLKSKGTFQPHWKILVKLYANITELGQTYVRYGLLRDFSTWIEFIQAFNKEDPLFEYIDAGNDSQAADSCVKECFNLFSGNVHCRHIMLAGSGDNGYTGFLRKYASSSDIYNHVTLIEARPFPNQLKEIASRFEITKFDGIFSESRLVPCINTSNITQGDFKNFNQIDYQATVFPPKVSRIGSVGQVERDAHNQSPVGPRSSVSTESINGIEIYFNQEGKRIDPEVRYDKLILSQLKVKKLCSRYYLTTCHGCHHSHSDIVLPHEMSTLRFLARRNPCDTAYCQDANCVAGHRCPFDGRCTFGQLCRFKPEMHNVDTKIVRIQTA